MPSMTISSPIGTLAITEADGAIIALDWSRTEADQPTALLARAADQLAAYFAGEIAGFDLPLAPTGSAFQRSVWEAMQAIPIGETRTYGEIASALGSSARAVGTACGQNPIPVIIPCHRIVGAKGTTGGYSGAGGVETKRFLLNLEHVAQPVLA